MRICAAALVALATYGGLQFGAGGVAIAAAARAQSIPQCADSMPRNTKKCFVKITAALGGGTCTATIAPEFLTLDGHSNVKITWRINEDNGDFRFCRNGGDGVFLKDASHETHGQVDQAWSTDNGDENSPPSQASCKNRYLWRFKNKISGSAPANTEYRYEVRFRDRNSTTKCEVDPWIKNGSPTIAPGAKPSR